MTMPQPLLPAKIKKIIKHFEKNNFEAYVVGGFIRNQLLGLAPKESGVDLTTNATPEQVRELFPNSKYENRFGTVIVFFSDNNYCEITTYRTERNYSDNRHPDKVAWGKSLAEDLKRRDFTINALCFNGKQFVDLFDGQKDLNNKVIRAIGEPERRFAEDSLRLLRAIRFSCQLDFAIEPKTLTAVNKQSHLLKKISIERVRDEFLKILASEKAETGVKLLIDTGLLKTFLPELVDAFKVNQISPQRHHIYDLGTHLVKTLANCHNPNPIVRLACLLHDIGKIKTRDVTPEGVVTFYNHEIAGTEMVYEIGKRLKLSKKSLTKLTKLVRYHQFTVNEQQTDKALNRFIRSIGKDNLQDIIDLRFADRLGSGAKPTSWRTELFLKRLEAVQRKPFDISDLKINGHDIMKTLKLKPSPKVGKILQQLFDKVEADELKNEKKELLGYLKKIT
jgi:tRNA nucleotidyltransferase (CCA-adding enzyme)